VYLGHAVLVVLICNIIHEIGEHQFKGSAIGVVLLLVVYLGHAVLVALVCDVFHEMGEPG